VERFVRAYAFLVDLFVKVCLAMACSWFGAFAFVNGFRPGLLPVTAASAVLAYLLIAPRRWMPTRWLEDVSFRRTWCVGLALYTPLYWAVAVQVFSGRFELSMNFVMPLVAALPVGLLILGALALRWWAVEPLMDPARKLRLAMLPLALWLVLVALMTKGSGSEPVFYLIAAVVGAVIAFTFRLTRNRNSSEDGAEG
jgi:hypothetical protein